MALGRLSERMLWVFVPVGGWAVGASGAPGRRNRWGGPPASAQHALPSPAAPSVGRWESEPCPRVQAAWNPLRSSLVLERARRLEESAACGCPPLFRPHPLWMGTVPCKRLLMCLSWHLAAPPPPHTHPGQVRKSGRAHRSHLSCGGPSVLPSLEKVASISPNELLGCPADSLHPGALPSLLRKQLQPSSLGLHSRSRWWSSGPPVPSA